MDWVKSFLFKRKQYVSLINNEASIVDSVNSEYVETDRGVPQGSILGPVLFLLYMNDIVDLTTSAHFTIYADDTSIIVSEKNEDFLKIKCNTILQNLNEWFRQNRLHFNIDKTLALRFHNRQKMCNNPSLLIGNKSIPNDNKSVKFLGLYVDECLTWKVHCENLISKLNSIVYQFRSIKTVLNIDQLKKLYYAEVDSRLRYGICFWGGSTLSYNVFLAQKRVLRCMAGLSNTDTCKNLFKEYEILTLPSLLIYELCSYVFNNKNKFISNKDVHGINTRQKNKFHIPFHNLNVALKSPNSLGLKVYNHLPPDIRECNSTNLFKKRLKIYLSDQIFYKLDEYFMYNPSLYIMK